MWIAEAVSCLLKAIEIYTDMGRFSIAAKHHQTIAEIYESELADLDRAVQHYEQAADYFKGEESNSSANKCMLKVAQYAAQLENYQKAIQIYEQVASSSLDNSLLKYSAKEYFFRAALCHLCIDVLNAQHAIQQYEQMYPGFQVTHFDKFLKYFFVRFVFSCSELCQGNSIHYKVDRFLESFIEFKEQYQVELTETISFLTILYFSIELQDSRESKLVKTLIGHVEEHNVEGFTETVKDYDSISRLDQWFTTILLRIKKQMAETPDLC